MYIPDIEDARDNVNDTLFFCRCHPYDYFFVTPNLNEATKWAKRNRSSAGELQIKRVRWSMLKDTKVVQFKPKEIDVMQDVSYLKAVTGGKEPPADGNWLGELINGSIILVEGKGSREPALGQFIVMDKTARCVCLMSPDAPGKQLWQNPHRFCSIYALREVLGVVEIPDTIPKEEKENEHHRADEHTPEQAT